VKFIRKKIEISQWDLFLQSKKNNEINFVNFSYSKNNGKKLNESANILLLAVKSDGNKINDLVVDFSLFYKIKSKNYEILENILYWIFRFNKLVNEYIENALKFVIWIWRRKKHLKLFNVV